MVFKPFALNFQIYLDNFLIYIYMQTQYKIQFNHRSTKVTMIKEKAKNHRIKTKQIKTCHICASKVALSHIFLLCKTLTISLSPLPNTLASWKLKLHLLLLISQKTCMGIPLTLIILIKIILQMDKI